MGEGAAGGMLALVGIYAVAAVAVPWALGRYRRVMACAAALVPAATAAWAATRVGQGELNTEVVWASDLGLVFDFRVDALSIVMLLLVGGVGAVVLCYAGWYFERSERLMIGTLVAFAGAMTGLVLADNLLVLYVFWELTTLSSFVLIGHPRPDRVGDRRAATQALLTTTAFGLVMLAGFVVLGQAAGTYRISELVAHPPGGTSAQVGVVLVLLGAFAKSAQIPLHAWLPAAMVAPTPVSAYLHAAAMVKAGVYLVARLAPAFAGVDPWRPLVLAVGLFSLLVGGVVALRQDDLKRLLAYGTISQLGFLMVLLGNGTRTAALAGAALLLAHGLFKAPLFLTVGAVEHETGTRRADRLSGAGRRLPVLAIAATAAIASMIGIPPFLGFVAKEAAFEAFAHGGIDIVVLAGVVAGSALTVAYGARFLHGAFSGGTDERPGDPWGLVVPVVVLAAAGFALGLVPGALQKLIGPYAGTLPAHEPGYKLALWHGLGLPIWMSVTAIVAGAGLYGAFGRTFPGRSTRPWLPDAQRAYDAVVEGTMAAAHAVTRRLQIGSLPVYLGVIALMVLVVPGPALVAGLVRGTGPDWPADGPRAWDTPAQLVLAAVVIVCALAAMWARGRLSAVLLLAGTGYGMTGLFVVYGAPDLGLTLVVVETLTLIMLVLVLRRLPERFPPRLRKVPARAATAVISLGVGGFVGLFLMVVALSRRADPVGPGYTRLAAQEHTKNVVNLILVDLRGLDTLGEITVLAATAVGVVSLVLTGPGVPRPGRPPLGGSSVLLEAVARLLTPTILVFSVYLFFAGHGRPGGGFAGGLVAGMAFVLRYLPGGRRELATALPVRPALLLGGGLGIAVATGAGGWASGGQFLSSRKLGGTVPVLGEVEIPTNLFFDAGVYLLVLGLVLTILTTLGASLEEPDAPEAAGEEPS
ncbi:hydrogen gas-evolving membrane-bound hydrogenase subunit E [Actinomadura sp. BRA 177]|uniref:hydrogen gas-evolving membrane-bound hydrogenase subunit E n=1 Tax=Actinomadura sp. BRA 177 TaxID=2745202 RepID=UPI001C3C4FC7|nr:hydrogen gas-evolving membrane-bound hydrogenase subunit E [Actinomadura sp. BRA 177]